MEEIDIVASNSRHQQRIALALKAGIERCGDRANIVRHTHYSKAHKVACWGWRAGALLRNAGREVLVLERAYVDDRFTYFSMGWNGLNRRAQFPLIDDGGARWRSRFGSLMQPWRDKVDGYALIMGQVPTDQAVAHIDFVNWLGMTARWLHALGWSVRYRPHPGAMNVKCPAPLAVGELKEALSGARFVVTFNSNSGVDAVLAGVPAVTSDIGAMAYEVTSHSCTSPVLMPEREKWAHRLAFTQWLPEEVASGEPWHHLRNLV